MQIEAHSREFLRDLVANMYTRKIPYADGTRIRVMGMWGTIAGHRFTNDNPIDPVYVVMFDTGAIHSHVIHDVIHIS